MIGGALHVLSSQDSASLDFLVSKTSEKSRRTVKPWIAECYLSAVLLQPRTGKFAFSPLSLVTGRCSFRLDMAMSSLACKPLTAADELISFQIHPLANMDRFFSKNTLGLNIFESLVCATILRSWTKPDNRTLLLRLQAVAKEAFVSLKWSTLHRIRI